MLNNLNKYTIVLASNSPRRKELLKGLGIKFVVKAMKDIDETYPSSLTGEDIPIYISKKKAYGCINNINNNELIITADTIVYLRDAKGGGEVLGKPYDKKEAINMLKKLSGKTHEVITGVCILTKEKCSVFSATSKVSFDVLKEEDILHYVDFYKPYDKAGAYGIQEWIGFIGVDGLNGSYYNVMGLPVQRLYKELQKF